MHGACAISCYTFAWWYKPYCYLSRKVTTIYKRTPCALRSFDASSDFLCLTQLCNGALFFFVFVIRKRIYSYGLVWCVRQCVGVCVDAPTTRCSFEYHYQLPRGGWQKCRAGVGRIWGGHTIQWNFLNGAFFLWIQGIERWAFRVQLSSRKMGRESSWFVPNGVTIQLE